MARHGDTNQRAVGLGLGIATACVGAVVVGGWLPLAVGCGLIGAAVVLAGTSPRIWDSLNTHRDWPWDRFSPVWPAYRIKGESPRAFWLRQLGELRVEGVDILNRTPRADQDTSEFFFALYVEMDSWRKDVRDALRLVGASPTQRQRVEVVGTFTPLFTETEQSIGTLKGLMAEYLQRLESVIHDLE